MRSSACVLAVAALAVASRAEAQPSGPVPDAGLLGAGQPQISLPPPRPLTPEQLRVVQRLDEAKQKDSGRGLDLLWIDVHGGFEQLGMQALNGGDQGFVGGFVKTSSSGGALGAAVGARLLFFSLLLRGRIGFFDTGQLYRIGPEVGFHVPMGRLEPHVTFGLGYAGVGNLKDNLGDAAAGAAAANFALRGFYTRLSAGVDYYPTPTFSLGADLSTDLVILSRPALTSFQVQQIQSISGLDAAHRASASLLTSTGTGVGGTIALTAVAGLHF